MRENTIRVLYATSHKYNFLEDSTKIDANKIHLCGTASAKLGRFNLQSYYIFEERGTTGSERNVCITAEGNVTSFVLILAIADKCIGESREITRS
jgi:hypothetical protein